MAGPIGGHGCGYQIHHTRGSSPNGFLLGFYWANVGPMWRQCRANVGQLKSFGGLCGAPWRSLRGKRAQPKTLWLRFFSTASWGYVGPMLGNLGSKLGPVGRFGGLCGAPWGRKHPFSCDFPRW